MANPKKINLGVFAAGEIPYPFEHTFKDKDKVAIDLTGWTKWVEVEGPIAENAYGAGVLALTDPANGKAQYDWVEADFTDVGKYKMLIWVFDTPSPRLASDLVVWEVYDGPGATP